MAGRGRAGGPTQGHGKKLVIDKHVGPGRGVDTEGWPFNMAVEAVDCIAVSGKVYSVANPAAIDICGRLWTVLGEIVGRMGLSGIGPLIGAASRKQYQNKQGHYRLPDKDATSLFHKQISHDIQHTFSMIWDSHGSGSRKWDQACRLSDADSGSPPDGPSSGSFESGS